MIYAADIEREFPRWHAWIGVNGVYYARRLLASPPLLLRGTDPFDLWNQVSAWEGNHS